MDPNELLEALRDCAQELIGEVENANRVGIADFSSSETAYKMAEKFEALDTWLTRGGFLPSDWKSQSRNMHERIDAIEREQVLERAREHSYRPYDTSGQDHA